MPASGPILVVEDDDDVRVALVQTLEDEGYSALGFGDGPSALAYLDDGPATPVVLLDWNMVPMNGGEFIDQVRRMPRQTELPIVLVTADVRAEDKARASHADGFLRKPLNLDALFAEVARFVNAPR